MKNIPKKSINYNPGDTYKPDNFLKEVQDFLSE